MRQQAQSGVTRSGIGPQAAPYRSLCSGFSTYLTQTLGMPIIASEQLGKSKKKWPFGPKDL